MIDGQNIHLDAGRAGQTYPHGLLRCAVVSAHACRRSGLCSHRRRARDQKELDDTEKPVVLPEYSLRRALVFASTGACLTGPASMLRLNLYDWLLPSNTLYYAVPLKTAIEVSARSHLWTCLFHCCGYTG